MAAGFLTGVVRAAEPAGRIVVFAEATVDAEVVRLGDIASLQGPAAEELATLEMGRTAAPGRMRTLPGELILRKLRAHGVDLERVRYVIPPIVHVRRHAQEITARVVRAIVEDYLRSELDRGEARAVVRTVEVPGAVRLAPGPYSSRVTLRRGAALMGRTQLLVEFLQDERVVSTMTARAHIAVFEDVYVARRAIPRGTVLTAEDIVAESRDVSTLPSGVITRPQDVIGMEARVAVAQLTPLRHEQFVAPTLVRRGEVVTLLAESAGLRVTTNGEVREDAPKGAQVRVLNRSSRTEVVGRVVDERTVTVTF